MLLTATRKGGEALAFWVALGTCGHILTLYLLLDALLILNHFIKNALNVLRLGMLKLEQIYLWSSS